eukprot:jgi/Galph1/4807/GphlegSOOS_G3478.1
MICCNQSIYDKQELENREFSEKRDCYESINFTADEKQANSSIRRHGYNSKIRQVTRASNVSPVSRIQAACIKQRDVENNEAFQICMQKLVKEQSLFTKIDPFYLTSVQKGRLGYGARRYEILDMLTFGSALSLLPETVVAAVYYFDRVLSKHELLESAIPSIATASLWLSSKTHESEILSSNYFVSYRSTKGTVNLASLVNAERFILSTLEWNISVTTTYDFIQIFGALFKEIHREVILMAESICKYAIIEDNMIQYSYSIQAASCILLAVRMSSGVHRCQDLLDRFQSLSVSSKDILCCYETLQLNLIGNQRKTLQHWEQSPKSIRDWGCM